MVLSPTPFRSGQARARSSGPMGLCLIPTPNNRITNLCFGGELFDTHFATCVDKVYERKVKTVGVHA
jgi:hypothetical protein